MCVCFVRVLQGHQKKAIYFVGFSMLMHPHNISPNMKYSDSKCGHGAVAVFLIWANKKWHPICPRLMRGHMVGVLDPPTFQETQGETKQAFGGFRCELRMEHEVWIHWPAGLCRLQKISHTPFLCQTCTLCAWHTCAMVKGPGQPIES